MNTQAPSFLLVLFIFNTLCLCQVTSEEAVGRVNVYLPRLPDSFDNDKLTVVLENATGCNHLMGCFENVPISASDLDPYQIGTKFMFHAKDQHEATVEFKLTHNCLSEDPNHCNPYPFDLQSLIDAPFDPSRRTIIFVSGYLTKPPTDWELGCKKTWLELEDVNIIIVDWSGANRGTYPTAARNTRLISRQITLLLYYLAKVHGLDATDDSFTEKIYMVGHSLGAHICGFVGMDLGGAVGRITGLDPAGPSFDELPERFRLDRSDAQLVDAIHSNAGAVLFSTRPRFGTDLMSGHIDLYANDGSQQPGCTSLLDVACSHGKSNKYYMAFLEHELSMRNYLKEKYNSLYRLNAYIGDKFDDFRTADSLLGHCPNALHINRDLYSSDMSSCSIPVDYFSWYSHVKDELQANHAIDFRPESRQRNSFYFMTNAETNDQSDHYLLKAHIGGVLQSRKSFGRGTIDNQEDALPNKCDISFETKMQSGIDGKFKIEQYHLVKERDHYDIIVPYYAKDIKSKYRIAKLDSEDFGLANNEDGSKLIISDEANLRETLLEIFPKTVTLSGVHVDIEAAEKRRQERENPGFFKSIYNMVRGNKEEEEISDARSCKLAVKHLAIRPLRRFHRMIVAQYSVKLDDDKPRPKIVILKDDETVLPSHIQHNYGLPSRETTELQLDTVIIGPYDKSFIAATKELDLDEILPIDANSYVKHISSDISPLTWLILTLMLAAFIISIAVITTLKVRKVDAIDKQALLMSSIPTISHPLG